MLRFIRRHAPTAGLALFAVTCFAAAPLSGQTLRQAVDSLRAGGNTIAGPGILNQPSPIGLAVWRSTSATALCVTATNVGSTPVGTRFQPGPSDSLVVGAGVTISNCADNVTAVLINCTVAIGDRCSVAWRIDKK